MTKGEGAGENLKNGRRSGKKQKKTAGWKRKKQPSEGGVYEGIWRGKVLTGIQLLNKSKDAEEIARPKGLR